MNKFIIKTILFLFPLIVILLGIELFYRFIPNNYVVKNQNIQERYNDIEVLILGNSHSFYGLNPVFFDKPTFNLSNISQTLYFDKLLFEKHFKNLKKLKYVILNVEYTVLSQLDDTSEDTWRKYYYQYYMDLQVPIISNLDPKRFFISSTRNFNTNIKLVKRYFLEKTIVDCDENGFALNYIKENRLQNIKEIAPVIVTKHEDNSVDFTKNLSRIQSIIDICNTRDIKVIIVNMPVSGFYAKGLNQKKLNKIFDSCILFKKKNSNVEYVNLFKDKRFQINDFYDPDHLHNEGAKKCSIIINDIINKNKD
ncbi:hypothetical protein [Flavobacterium flavigenum]|uniref:hypothetical protein n=1 Tax=Flavobacterium flavigenum TaxID=3003258 RepID=UPI002482FD10|nr:hypothetical protein [Flavobacterium flavigenum]